jgi:hypothetical protein
LVDVEIFANAQAAIDGLERHDCSVALSWCASHRQRLHKLKVRARTLFLSRPFGRGRST